MEEFDDYIPFGDNCCSALALQQANLRKASYPFDWVQTSPKLIQEVLENNFSGWCEEFIDSNGITRNKYRVDLQHYMHLPSETRSTTLKRRIERFMALLNSNRSICFIYTTEKTNKLAVNVENDYKDFIKLTEYILSHFPNLRFQCYCFNNNINRSNVGSHIKNFSVKLPSDKPFDSEIYRKACADLICSMNLKLSPAQNKSLINAKNWYSTD